MTPEATVPPKPPAELSGLDFDYSLFVTEDDTPLDSFYQERQQRLLVEPLYAAWGGHPPGTPWVAAANVGIFYARKAPAVVPDAFISTGVKGPDDWTAKEGRSYFVWDMGKPPDIVVEMVSNREGGEDTDKIDIYQRAGVGWYVVFDPFQYLSDDVLRVFKTDGGVLKPTPLRTFENLGLGVAVWQGTYQGFEGDLLRWVDATGQLLPTALERADLDRRRAEEERERADLEYHRAEQVTRKLDAERDRGEQVTRQLDAERQKRERLAEALRKLGLDPDNL